MKKFPLLVSASLVAAAVLAPAAQGLAASLSSPVSVPGDSDAALPITNFVALAVDSAHHHLFISTGTSTDSLLVTDERGAAKQTIALAGASGMTLVGSQLFVAERFANDVAVIDTAKLKVVSRLATGLGTCPNSIAVSAARHLTYEYTCGRQPGGLGVIDLTAPSAAPRIVPGTFDYPLVRAVPNTTTVIAAGTSGCQAGVSIVDVSGSPTVRRSVLPLSDGCSEARDLAVNPDGASFVIAAISPTHGAFSTSDLSQVDVYPGEILPLAAAFSSNGKAFADGSGFAERSGVTVVSTVPGAHVLGRETIFGDPWQLQSQGMGFSSGGDKVFAVTGAWLPPFGPGSGLTFRLHVLSLDKTPVQITASAPANGIVHSRFSVSGHIAFADGIPRAVQLNVTRYSNGTTTTLPPVTTSGADGSFSFTDTVDAKGAAVYTITYAGDVFHNAGKAIAETHLHTS